MLKRKHLIAIIAIIVAAALVVTFTLSAFRASGSEGGNPITQAVSSLFGAEEVIADEMTKEDKEKAFELSMTSTFFDVDEQTVEDYLDNAKLGYGKDENGNYLVPFSYNSMPTMAADRSRSAKVMGLSNKIISDAPDFAYENLTDADVEKCITAAIGDTIKVSNLKELSKEFKRALYENPVLFEGFVKLTKDLHYGDSKSIEELNGWVSTFLKKCKKARNYNGDNGSKRGINIWFKGIDDKPFMTQEYLEYVTAYLGLVDETEANVERLESKVNYHLVGGDLASCTHLTKAKYQEDKAALTFTYYFKDGSVGPKIGSNLSDKRPETFKPVAAKERSNTAPDGTPSVDHKKPTDDPTSKTDDDDGETKKESDPSSESYPVKNEDEQPDKDDNIHVGTDDYEEQPYVKPSDSYNVDESQYQPQAEPQGGGTATDASEIKDGYESQSGNTVSDKTDADGSWTEYDQSSTDDYADKADRSQENQAGNNNGEMSAPD